MYVCIGANAIQREPNKKVLKFQALTMSSKVHSSWEVIMFLQPTAGLACRAPWNTSWLLTSSPSWLPELPGTCRNNDALQVERTMHCLYRTLTQCFVTRCRLAFLVPVGSQWPFHFFVNDNAVQCQWQYGKSMCQWQCLKCFGRAGVPAGGCHRCWHLRSGMKKHTPTHTGAYQPPPGQVRPWQQLQSFRNLQNQYQSQRPQWTKLHNRWNRYGIAW